MIEGYLVTDDAGLRCFYFKKEVAEWKAGEFADRGHSEIKIEPLIKAAA